MVIAFLGRWCAPALALIFACAPKLSSAPARELQRVKLALLPAQATEVSLLGPTREWFALAWDFRFVTPQPAAAYRQSLMQALLPDYKCREERRRVRCSRTLPGDRLALDVRANPYMDKTLIRARLIMSAD